MAGKWFLGLCVLFAAIGCSSPVAPTVAGPAAGVFPSGFVALPAGTAVSSSPGFVVKDASGVPVSGTSVSFAITGPARLAASVAVSGAHGVVVVALTPGPVIGKGVVRAWIAGLADTVSLGYEIVSGPVASLRLVSAKSPLGLPGRRILTSVWLQALDAFANPVTSGMVTYRVTSGGGSVAGGASSIGGRLGPGLIEITDWTLGGPGLNSLEVSAAGAPSLTLQAEATSGRMPFDMDVRFVYDATSTERADWADAVLRLTQAVLEPLPQAHLVAAPGACFPGSPAVDTVTTGMVVLVRPGASAAVSGTEFSCVSRQMASGAQVAGISVITVVAGNPVLYAHELEHAMGMVLGSWSTAKVADGYVYTGPRAIAELERLTGRSYASGIPLSVDGHHWGPEIIGDFLSGASPRSPGRILSTVTLAAWQDIGFVVDVGKGDAFVPDPD